jgi:diadenosine tetraphosphate (Ap4A) HIT family hydrolase
VVYADELWTVILGMDVPGWFMVILNRHNNDWLWGLWDKEAASLGPLIRDIGAAVKAEATSERVYSWGSANSGKTFISC